MRMRVGFPPLGSASITLDAWIDIGLSTICPVRFCAEALRCFLTMFTPSIVTRFFLGDTFAIVPVAPRFLPAITTTLSPFFNFIVFEFLYCIQDTEYHIPMSYDLGSQCDDFLVSALNHFARNRTEYAVRLRLLLFFLHEHYGVLIKTNVCAVWMEMTTSSPSSA